MTAGGNGTPTSVALHPWSEEGATERYSDASGEYLRATRVSGGPASSSFCQQFKAASTRTSSISCCAQV